MTSQNTKITEKPFGNAGDKPVSLYSLKTPGGTSAEITNFGGIIISLHTPDRNGDFDDITLGFDDLAPYLSNPSYFGAIIGRFGNRITNGQFELDGNRYNLAVNNAPNALHGGIKGFDKVVWDSEITDTPNGFGIKMTYLSPDGEEGYPGTLNTSVYFTLSDNKLSIQYEAHCDKPTIINLTNHSYFNLRGHKGGSIADHRVQIDADKIVAWDERLCPTGELIPVSATPFDFRQSKAIAPSIDQEHPQIKYATGFDHTFVLNKPENDFSKAATVTEETSGRTLEAWTDQPAVHLYSGNFLEPTLAYKDAAIYESRNGFCLETQHFPDSPNHPHFPSTRLDPDEKFESKTEYRFGTLP